MAKLEEVGEKVMVIQDGSRKFSWNAAMGIVWVLRNSPFRKGDEITLLVVLHQVNNPSMYALMEASMCKISITHSFISLPILPQNFKGV
ncbi:serine/threonine-protein kinase CDG1 isoform X1 [Cucumis melo var. makuwa]|uniref:Serine/threonine-protein kinase CDG1 isoform X1 n=1 Tax=Cucumis melo var. makuwa TaxID=1194695 RepID=A0A5A7SXW5_CUCMM|nr:serine/threonine-protein kinase CDG1 isoform X1 [Cucumis melo var. makuwa]TYK15813.1 serine/threonine-protein kinase CDG1 isoform X1 [Cucumis melo var. makuwa]